VSGAKRACYRAATWAYRKRPVVGPVHVHRHAVSGVTLCSLNNTMGPQHPFLKNGEYHMKWLPGQCNMTHFNFFNATKLAG
jgi:ribulose-5-phosphate 4-epimerase/fuculose-1-phosphate aldolase